METNLITLSQSFIYTIRASTEYMCLSAKARRLFRQNEDKGMLIITARHSENYLFIITGNKNSEIVHVNSGKKDGVSLKVCVPFY